MKALGAAAWRRIERRRKWRRRHVSVASAKAEAQKNAYKEK
jgi:hypothetical protein